MSEPNDHSHAIDNLKIYSVRGHSVVLDTDLARVYGVETRVFNHAFRRDKERFPGDFAFQFTTVEWKSLRCTICDLRSRGKGPAPQIHFTEHGALMAATILNSAQAVR